MRIVLVALVTALVGFGTGWMARGKPREIVKVIDRPAPLAPTLVAKGEPPFPDLPKPSIEPPKPSLPEPGVNANPMPLSLGGHLPQLPTAAPSGPLGPLAPVVPAKLPVADLNADEALARRTVLAAGGEIVSAADAKDSIGNVGRALVAETEPGGKDRLRTALRRALGDRAVLSDGGTVGGSSPDVRKAEDALAALRRQLERARIDFLPNAPILLDLEDAYRKAERSLSDARKTTARQRIGILLRSQGA